MHCFLNADVKKIYLGIRSSCWESDKTGLKKALPMTND